MISSSVLEMRTTVRPQLPSASKIPARNPLVQSLLGRLGHWISSLITPIAGRIMM